MIKVVQAEMKMVMVTVVICSTDDRHIDEATNGSAGSTVACKSSTKRAPWMSIPFPCSLPFLHPFPPSLLPAAEREGENTRLQWCYIKVRATQERNRTSSGICTKFLWIMWNMLYYLRLTLQNSKYVTWQHSLSPSVDSIKNTVYLVYIWLSIKWC